MEWEGVSGRALTGLTGWTGQIRLREGTLGNGQSRFLVAHFVSSCIIAFKLAVHMFEVLPALCSVCCFIVDCLRREIQVVTTRSSQLLDMFQVRG